MLAAGAVTFFGRSLHLHLHSPHRMEIDVSLESDIVEGNACRNPHDPGSGTGICGGSGCACEGWGYVAEGGSSSLRKGWGSAAVHLWIVSGAWTQTSVWIWILICLR